MKSIAIVIPYFGTWPEWIDIFLTSCAYNPTIDWLIYTDCPIPADPPINVRFYPTSLTIYCNKISASLGITYSVEDRYKLCDVRPMIGVIHDQELQHYDVFGYGDIDVIYGDIRHFYNDDILAHDIISTHGYIVSGHLTLLKNTKKIRESFLLLPDWKEKLGQRYKLSWENNLNECGLTHLFHPDSTWKSEKLRAYRTNTYFVEQYTTPFKPEPWINGELSHPDIWYWRKGKVTNKCDQNREFIYLHFMNFSSARYVSPDFGPAPWLELTKLVHFDPKNINEGTVRIDRSGFHLEDSNT